MKNRLVRILAALLVLILLVHAVGAVDFNASLRHVPASSPGSAVYSYYTGQYSFESLRNTAGSTQNTMNSPLYRSLHTLMFTTLTRTYSYRSLPEYWASSDSARGISVPLYFYSDVPRPDSSQLSREHVWAKSHGTFYESGAGSDLHHLRPEDTNVNSTRNNYTFGTVRGALTTYRTKRFGDRNVLWYDAGYTDNGCNGIVEVADEVKGDVARILLYVYVTYEQPNLFTNTAATGSGNLHSDGRKVIESLDTLLNWCQLDPVDQWELRRNDIVESLQGNRNVFIDYPELAWCLFGRSIPQMTTPSGYAKQYGGRFSDVASNIWYAAAVDYAVDAGLMQGVGAGRFAPNAALSRAQLVTILYRMAGSPAVSTSQNSFRDVKSGTWYSAAVRWAAKTGIVKGYGDGRFGPDDPVTREQLVTILYRQLATSPASSSALNKFPDRAQVSSYAREAMSWAVTQGLIAGVRTAQGNQIAPRAGATRAEFATILMRLGA